MAENKSGTMADWKTEEDYWRNNYSSRPYIGTDKDFDRWRGAYRYGYDAANRYQGRKWEDVESDLRGGWDTYEHRGTVRSTWEQVKAAVRDGWDRITGKR